MSEERVVHNLDGTISTMSEAIKNDPEENKRIRAEKKAKLARILERGMAIDRLTVDLPDDVYGEWIPNDKMEIHRMQTLGFEIDTKHAPKRALHDDGTGMSIVGDTVFMTCSRDDHELMDEIRRENFDRNNGKPGTNKIQAEERDFTTSAKTLGIGPTVEESSARSVRKTEIESALKQGATPAPAVIPAGNIIR